uniref:Retrotransposon gag domain-containing protein n=1 Tax=Ananas comosus var. bracteatus TaxID=296719 RepID=A0A6V7QCG2_ANACO|nr:unnamed protein product [Ananas comosus var. bracteatus]
MHMKKLFSDTFVEERDRVWLATHHLDGEAYRWWLDLQENPSTDLAAITWKKFKELLLAHYFPTSVKRKMEQDLCSLRQGDRTVVVYKREFLDFSTACLSSCRTTRTRPASSSEGCDRRSSGSCNPLTSKPTGRWWIARLSWRAARQRWRSGERAWTGVRPRGLRQRVRARCTLGGRRNTLGASSVGAAQQCGRGPAVWARPSSAARRS